MSNPQNVTLHHTYPLAILINPNGPLYLVVFHSLIEQHTVDCFSAAFLLTTPAFVSNIARVLNLPLPGSSAAKPSIHFRTYFILDGSTTLSTVHFTQYKHVASGDGK